MQVASLSQPVALRTLSSGETIRRPVVSHDILRDVVEILQLSTTSPVVVLETIGADLPTTKRVVSELANELPDDVVVGRIDNNRVGIVIPQMTGQRVRSILDAASGAEQLKDCQFRLWTSEPASDSAQSIFAMYAKPTPRWKRAMDIVGASAILAFSFPFLVAAAGAIKLTNRGPILFRQKRVGFGGQTFEIIKLRTMHVDAEALRPELDHHNESSGLAFKIRNDPRVFPVGRILRRLSIDELPQLWNVLRGEMSLVGPRPLPVTDWKPTVSWHCRRHDVHPGLTGIWQVSGRSEIDFDAWVKMDLEYISRQSFLLDSLVLLKTVPAVFSRNGAS